MEDTNYIIKDIYQGGYGTFDPKGPIYSTDPRTGKKKSTFSGYRLGAGEMGTPTKPDTANQIQQVANLLNQGMIPIEVGALSPDVFSQIPKTHFKEISRMGKLTGAKFSVHAPIVEPSGVGERGWSEINRELAERQLMDVVDKTTELNDKGGIPITIHSANMGGSEYKMTKDGKKIERMVVINRETGEQRALEEEKLFYPGGKVVETPFTPERRLRSLNNTSWDNSLFQIEVNRENADRILKDSNPIFIQKSAELKAIEDQARRRGVIVDLPELSDKEAVEINKVNSAREFISQAQLNANAIFSQAYKMAKEDGDTKQLEYLQKISEQYGKNIGLEKGGEGNNLVIKNLERYYNPAIQSQAIQILRDQLNELEPRTFVPIEEFALKKSSETFANVAFHAYDKYKDKAPKISIENLYPGMPFSMKKEGENGLPGVKDLIEETRKKFVQKAMDKGISESEAKKQAENIIGMTFDVGHLNIAKKKGFTDKDLAKESAEIAKYVKHVHLTDNFGFSDSHLPPGMGNVPFKEHLENLEKAGVLKDTLKIVEAGGWVQHFGSSPLPYTLEGMGSSIQAGKGPYWSQAPGLYQDYFGGYGMMLPQVNYETFGSGFSQLPSELGGVRPGAQGSRLSGRGME